jgi:hypothetical protein
MTLNRRNLLTCGAAITVLVGCSNAESEVAIKVYKISECTCCEGWVKHLKAAGFKVEIEERADLAPLNKELGVPDDLTSCHIGVVGDYAIMGHVPAEDIKRFLAARPTAKGLAVPGMPTNSPGMEVAGQPNEHYTVWQFSSDGTRSAFAVHG